MRRLVLLLVLSGSVVFCAEGVDAQELPRDLSSRLVQIEADGVRHQGTVSRITDEDLSITVGGGDVRTFSWVDVESVHVRTTKRLWARFALVGAAGTGLILAALAEEFESCFLRYSCDGEFHTDAFLRGFLIGAALGGVTGALVGALFEGEDWQPWVAPPSSTGSGAWQLGLRFTTR